MEDVLALIVTYNRKDLLKECLNAVSNQTVKCDILLIDNNSSDGTEYMIKDMVQSQNFKDLSYINTGQNLGGAGGFSHGMKEGVKRGYKYLWVMDDDTVPQKNCLEKLLYAGRKLNGEFGVLTSKVIWTDGSLCSMNIPRDTLNHKLTEFDNELQKIVIASFVSMLIPAERIRELGLPIKEFFIWVDDWEYARRISSRYDSYLIPDSVVVHKTKDNNGADIIKDSGSRIDRYRYMYRNSVYFYKREGVYGVFYLTARTILHLIKVLLFSKTDKIRKCKLIISSTMEGIRFNPKIEYVNK